MSFFANLIYFVPVVIALAALEALILSRAGRRPYNWRASLVSLADLLGREFIIYRLPAFGLGVPVIAAAYQHRLTNLPLDGISAFLLLFIGQEFFYYWFHRASHRVRWFWATHSVHHSPSELNLSAAFRFGWTGRLSGTGIFFAPLVWIGFPVQAVFGLLSLNLLYQFWLHATWIPKLGWLEYVLNTPSHHRVHHAANVAYLDANYGGVLILFDRLFGTFIAERADLPCRYGLVKPQHSNNLLTVEFQQWAALARDLRQARSWRERALYLFGPPGWRPDGTGLTTEQLRRDAALASAAE
jgi:sterol desaturase/sphingolipid hydroxylase (fatty acid hydroxylase superfamily)